jgi:hypothetical protein
MNAMLISIEKDMKFYMRLQLIHPATFQLTSADDTYTVYEAIFSDYIGNILTKNQPTPESTSIVDPHCFQSRYGLGIFGHVRIWWIQHLRSMLIRI